jgi:hypothetical protein
MNIFEYEEIINIIRVLCPRLKKLAAKSDNVIDDVIVNFICSIVGAENKKEVSNGT